MNWEPVDNSYPPDPKDEWDGNYGKYVIPPPPQVKDGVWQFKYRGGRIIWGASWGHLISEVQKYLGIDISGSEF